MISSCGDHIDPQRRRQRSPEDLGQHEREEPIWSRELSLVEEDEENTARGGEIEGHDRPSTRLSLRLREIVMARAKMLQRYHGKGVLRCAGRAASRSRQRGT